MLIKLGRKRVDVLDNFIKIYFSQVVIWGDFYEVIMEIRLLYGEMQEMYFGRFQERSIKNNNSSYNKYINNSSSNKDNKNSNNY